MADTVGQQDIRGLNVSKVVTGFALQEYVFKQLCIEQTTDKWQDRYFAETAKDLTGGLGSSVEGVPRLAAFPYGEVSWTQKNSYMKKHGMDAQISFEDAHTNDVDVIARSLLRIARAVASSVDAEIWDTLTENRNAVDINSTPTIGAWDSGTLDPIADILSGQMLIANNNYNPQRNGFLTLSPKDKKSLLTWLISTKGASIPQFSSEKVVNGRIGELLGLTILESTNVTADYAAIIIGKEAGTWKSAVPLTVKMIEDPGRAFTIRAFEIGAAQLKNAKAVTLLTNTQS